MGYQCAIRLVEEPVPGHLLIFFLYLVTWAGDAGALYVGRSLGRKPLAHCREAGVEPLVEVHDDAEMERALSYGVACIGINNRNLKTFDVSLETTHRLARKAGEDHTLISESGIRSAADVEAVKSSGAHAVLVGEHLLRQADLRHAVRDLMGAIWVPS